jgi:hypothetical protein
MAGRRTSLCRAEETSATYERSVPLNRAGNLLRHRLTLLLAVLAIFTVCLIGPHQREALAVCDTAEFHCYSDATYSTVVGRCYHKCCGTWVCTGQITNYQILDYKVVCETW